MPNRRPLTSCAFLSASLSTHVTPHSLILAPGFWLLAPSCYPEISPAPMHIKKTRLLTPGPTPIYPKALHAMLGADMHHRTQDFRNVFLDVLADLKFVRGPVPRGVCLAASGAGSMEASVTNCFSPGDRVIVCTAGK